MDLLYLIFIYVVALVTFLTSFFQFSVSVGSLSDNPGEPPPAVEDLYRMSFRFNNSNVYNPVIDKVVFIVIDSLRYDFLGEPTLLRIPYMPYTMSLVNGRNSHADSCITKAKASPPSVTMPRIKAMTTGGSPTYIDIIRNFNTTEVMEDNILSRAKSRGLKLVFYGDDTWLKMFPNYFIRSEGVTSFFVSDHTEVDFNVTRNVHKELRRDDWNVLILHYLGLDHIGHVHGPFNHLIQDKLLEMDNVLKLIHAHLLEMKAKTGKSFMIILGGDHGMKDQGGHGGASAAETTIPFVTIGLPCSSSEKDSTTQLDIVPTLSVLMGLPIPLKSSGSLMLNLLEKLSPGQLLFSLFYNSELLAQKYRLKKVNSANDECFSQYLKAKELYSTQLQSSSPNIESLRKECAQLFEKSSKCMSSYLIDHSTTFDVPSMIFALGLAVQVTVLLIFRPDFSKASVLGVIIFAVSAACLLSIVGNNYLCESNGTSGLCTNPVFAFVLGFFFVVNCTFMGYIEINPQKRNFRNKLMIFLSFGTVLHMVSVISSSFIEEEHQIWYYLTPSFVALLVIAVMNSKKNLPQLISILCLFRFFRKLNSTGDKWAAEEDIGDILQEDNLYIAIFIFVSLFCNTMCHVWIRLTFLASKIPSRLHMFLIPTLGACHFLFQVSMNNLNPGLDLYDRFTEHDIQFLSAVFAWSYWVVFLAIIVEDSARLYTWRNKFTRLESWSEVLRIILMSWLFAIALLQKGHNIILVPVFIFVCHNIQKALFDLYESSELILCIIHHWLGLLFYFYQGNSNSLATIDVSAGYVGLTHFNFAHVGFQIGLNVSAFPVLSYLLLLNYLIRNSDCTQRFLKKIRRATRVLLIIQVFHLTFYLFVITFLRYHLFIWSVFSPKLLYLSYHSAVFFLLVFVFELVYQALEYAF